MRLDHIALRTKDRKKTAKFFMDTLGYQIQQEFTIDFGDGQTAQCIALEPPERRKVQETPWTTSAVTYFTENGEMRESLQEFHIACELFISDGSPNSIVDLWVKEHGGIGGIHHVAYQTDDVAATMKLWQEKGYAEFTTDKPLTCPEDELIQVFSKPSEITGVVIELIKRGSHGFCRANVQKLMESTKGL